MSSPEDTCIIDGCTFTKESAVKYINLTALAALSAKIKTLHWSTKKGLKHLDLDRGYEELSEAMDSFVECCQGANDELPNLNEEIEITFKVVPDSSIREYCKELHAEFNKLAAPLIKGSSPLRSLSDDVENAFYLLNSLLLRN